MKIRLSLICLTACLLAGRAAAQATPSEEDVALIRAFEGLRVADVSDAMDLIGLPDRGLMDQSIAPLWRDFGDFTHQFCGIAVTARYVPTTRTFPTNLDKEAYEAWRTAWYAEISPEPFSGAISTGTVLVIDNAGDGDTGTTGSFNSLLWKKRGMVGLVCAGGVRDTDEIARQRIPVYTDYYGARGRGIRPGRNEIESVQQPVVVGGVLVRPGDVVVADGDGVIVVPRARAVDVAMAAREVLDTDKRARRRVYEQLGLPLDSTVTIEE